MKSLIKHFYILIILILVISCEKNPEEEIQRIIDVIADYNHSEALIELSKLEQTTSPDFNYLGVSIHLLKYVCYEAMGDFKNAGIEYEKFIKIQNPDPASQLFNFGFMDIILYSSYIRSYKLDVSNNILERYYNFEKTISKLGEPDNILLGLTGLKRSMELSRIIAITVLYYEDVVDDTEPLENQLDFFFNYLIALNNDYYVWISFLEFLDYKMVNGSYYSDYIWDYDITKQYFQEMVDKGLITAETLEIIKEKVYREDIPQDFIDLFEMVE